MKIIVALILFVLALASVAATSKNPICYEPPKSGGEYVDGCLLDIPAWSYDSNIEECIPYLYGGCTEDHNDNFFYTVEECEDVCGH